MKPGPKHVHLGTMPCPLCHGDMRVTTNKEGFPTAFCKSCRAQLQVRAERGSQLLLGKVSEWTSPDAAAAMVEESDAPAMYQKLPERKRPSPPPHLSKLIRPSSPTPVAKPPQPAAEKPKGFLAKILDTPL